MNTPSAQVQEPECTFAPGCAEFWRACKQQIATYGFADSENNQIACATTKHSQALRFFLLALMDVTAP
ncbi:hypothetical protein [Mesorhizobium sp. L-2-11]|uniref:hypothetical protein n=1 Tax=Mesorhizobium sp. L-2-11 TaxID=2744521 RepID=UPI0019288CF2|nr:hypothetical protein [Mesorhizobium sp. L-2-11]